MTFINQCWYGTKRMLVGLGVWLALIVIALPIVIGGQVIWSLFPNYIESGITIVILVGCVVSLLWLFGGFHYETY